jgi:hypothetical protein
VKITSLVMEFLGVSLPCEDVALLAKLRIIEHFKYKIHADFNADQLNEWKAEFAMSSVVELDVLSQAHGTGALSFVDDVIARLALDDVRLIFATTRETQRALPRIAPAARKAGVRMDTVALSANHLLPTIYKEIDFTFLSRGGGYLYKNKIMRFK